MFISAINVNRFSLQSVTNYTVENFTLPVKLIPFPGGNLAPVDFGATVCDTFFFNKRYSILMVSEFNIEFAVAVTGAILAFYRDKVYQIKIESIYIYIIH